MKESNNSFGWLWRCRVAEAQSSDDEQHFNKRQNARLAADRAQMAPTVLGGDGAPHPHSHTQLAPSPLHIPSPSLTLTVPLPLNLALTLL